MTREEDIRNAVETMRKGGVILYPTDTVWGIGCDATNVEAVKRVYQIKQRDDSKALICLVDSDARLQRYFHQVPDVAWQLIDSLIGDEYSKPTTLVLDWYSDYQRTLFQRTVFPFSESDSLHFSKYQWRTGRTELL